MEIRADTVVVLAYLAIVLGWGCWFARGSGHTDQFMSAGRSLPGWAVGFSMFGSYISSISFLANPGKAFESNWNAFAFSLAAPLAAWIATRWFVPFYRHSKSISAYQHLENRFGPWARLYATICFLLTQTARMGTVIYLLALAVGPLTGWNVKVTILVTGIAMTFFTLLGGIKAVVWVGVLQSVVLIAGVTIALTSLVSNVSGGVEEIFRIGSSEQKFSLGSFGPSLTQPTFWVLFIFGFIMHLGNFGTDQSYIQRYLTASSDREAAKSIWLAALLYVPVAGVFFFIGTGLFVFYGQHPAILPENTPVDAVFPHFIGTQLPEAAGGLVIAAVFAASMDSNLNSMATLTLCDIYQRFFRLDSSEKESMRVLRAATLGWGVLSIIVALTMVRAGAVLDVWLQLSGLLSGGVLGLFLLGIVSNRVTNTTAKIAVTLGLFVIVAMGIQPLFELPDALRLPFHTHLTIVFGTLTILIAGLVLSSLTYPDKLIPPSKKFREL